MFVCCIKVIDSNQMDDPLIICKRTEYVVAIGIQGKRINPNSCCNIAKHRYEWKHIYRLMDDVLSIG